MNCVFLAQHFLYVATPDLPIPVRPPTLPKLFSFA